MADDIEQIAHEFANTLNRHGFAFQAAVLEEARRLADNGLSRFAPDVTEFPVELRSSQTRIDFVLRNRRGTLRLVAECKRANPAFANWCFAKMPLTRRTDDPEWPMIDRLRRDRGDIFYVEAIPIGPTPEDGLFDISFEVKSQRKGDASPAKSTAAIEDAATQVSRGTNGLIEFFLRDPSKLEGVTEIQLLPVVFTTAGLFISDVDLRKTDLMTGELAPSEVTLRSVPWLLYQYRLSPSLKHVTGYSVTTAELVTALEREFLRSIAIVAPAGMEQFFRWASSLWAV
jgi:hypothetical protein